MLSMKVRPGEKVVIRHAGVEMTVEIVKVRKGKGSEGNAQVEFTGPREFEIKLEKRK